jgi:hypothetical protein
VTVGIGVATGDGTLDNCTGGTDHCQSVFISDATTQCSATCNPDGHPVCTCGGNTTCQECVDQQQIARFICSDACRDSFRANSTVSTEKANCRATFQSCVHACPPLP